MSGLKRAAGTRADVSGREEVAVTSKPVGPFSVVTVLGMVERKLHEARERDRPGRADFVTDDFQKLGMSGGNPRQSVGL